MNTTYRDRFDMIKGSVPQGSVGAEIGVLRGDFSALIISAVKPKRLYLVDSWKHFPGNEYFLEPTNVDQKSHDLNYGSVLKRFEDKIKDGSVVVVRKSSEAAAKTIKSLDWVYVDASHLRNDVMNDLLAWEKTLKPEGVIMGHDYVSTPLAKSRNYGVVEAVDEFCTMYGWEVSALTTDTWTSYLLRRKI